MSGVKTVTGALPSFREPAHSSVLAQLIEAFPASGQQFMCVGLMPHIPDDLVLRQLKGQVKSHRQLHHPQIGCQMSSGRTDLVNQEPADLFCQQRQILFFYFFNIIGLVDSFQIHEHRSYFLRFMRDSIRAWRYASSRSRECSASIARCEIISTSALA